MSDLAKMLHAETDKLNEAIRTFEGSLLSLKLGVAAEVPFPPTSKLRFQRCGKSWQMMVNETNTTEWTPLRSCSRRIRAEAIPLFPALVEAMLVEAQRQLEEDGQKHEKTEWHRVVMFGKTAENCAQYLDKGRSVYVEGKLQTRTWDDKTTGEKKYMTEIVAQNVTFLGGGEGKSRGGKSEPAKEKSTDHGYGPAADDEVPF